MNFQSSFPCTWAHIEINKQKSIQFANDTAKQFLQDTSIIGKNISSVLPWLRDVWLEPDAIARVVKTSQAEKVLLEIISSTSRDNSFHLFFRPASDYNDSEHLWCEVADSIIGVQRFIDTSYDGITVTDGQGKVLAVNDAFIHISGLQRKSIIGENFAQLIQSGLMPQSCSLQAIKCGETYSAVIKYPQGKEAMVSSTPLFDQNSNIVRVLSNVRDISELNVLHEKLKCAKALATGFQRELKAIQAASLDVNYNLTRSRVMEHLYALLAKVADTDLQLLITGESGIGKSALAKFVHSASVRNDTGHFIHVNCSAIPENLLESELFGYEEGAFTSAKRSKVGLFELANKGTLFLDEIGDMPLSLQAKILNVLQEGKFYRVGGTKEITVDVRIIAATNMKLEQLMTQGRFRKDLYYRLNVVPIHIPPLADRQEDIPPLIAYYLEKINQKYGKAKIISPEVMEILISYRWPGNIRELINLLERLVVVVDESMIDLRHLPPQITEMTEFADFPSLPITRKPLWNPKLCLKESIEILEDKMIEEAISYCGSLKSAAEKLGVNVSTLIRKRKRKYDFSETEAN